MLTNETVVLLFANRFDDQGGSMKDRQMPSRWILHQAMRRYTSS